VERAEDREARRPPEPPPCAASKLYAARPRRLAAARGATQVQPKAHPASLQRQSARPPTHPLRLMRRALLKGEKAEFS